MLDETEAKPPNWLQTLKLLPWFMAALTAGIAIGDWRSNQSSAIANLAAQVGLLNTRIEQLERSQSETGGKVIGLSVRVDALHETLLENRDAKR
jgi:hypothetical protein